MNEIDKKQLEPRMLNLLRARTLIYRRAKNVQAVGFAISLGFPILGLVVSAYLLPGSRSLHSSPLSSASWRFCCLTAGTVLSSRARPSCRKISTARYCRWTGTPFWLAIG